MLFRSAVASTIVPPPPPVAAAAIAAIAAAAHRYCYRADVVELLAADDGASRAYVAVVAVANSADPRQGTPWAFVDLRFRVRAHW